MKRITLFLAGTVAITFALASYVANHRHQIRPTATSECVAVDAPEAEAVKTPRHEPDTQAEARSSNRTPGDAAPTSVEAIAFSAALDTLVSTHATYAEKQAAWKELQDSGRLSDAAAALDSELKRITNDSSYSHMTESITSQSTLQPQPQSQPQPEAQSQSAYFSAAGQAYLKMCGATTDVRSQAIWAMTADANFESALNLDPSNWDARYTKAVAMSYWPANLNKGDEVIQQFNTLIQQQEQQTPQPQFAQSYEWLGKQYQKTGQMDAAQQVWQRGASLYPDNQSLQSLLAPPTTAQQ